MLKIKDMNLNSVIRQGDTQPREYQLDTGNLNLNLTNKSATIRLMTADFQGIGYETTATVSSDNKISFSIDDVIPAREYRLEVTVDDYVFPSRATDGRFDIDPSSHGQEVNIIQVIGKDEIVREVKEQIEPFLGDIEQAELNRQAQEEARETAEGERQEEYQKYGQRIQLGKNLFNGQYMTGAITGAKSSAPRYQLYNTADFPNGRSILVSVPQNSDITISKTVSNRFVVALADNMPKNGDSVKIIRDSSDGHDGTKFTLNTGTYNFLIVMVCNGALDIPEFVQIEKGTIQTQWEKYGYKLTPQAEPFDKKETQRKPFLLSGDDHSDYEASVPSHSSPSDDPYHIYEIIDGMMAENPKYITKSQLGTSTLGVPIYLYEFKMPTVQNSTYKIPKLFMNSGLHGHEKQALWGTVNFFVDLCEGWRTSNALRFLRGNVHILWVPLLNPDGWQLNQRKNGNGVDLNRNFPTGWEPVANTTSEVYSGVSAGSEIETMIVMDLLEAHPDIYFTFDIHNYGTVNDFNDVTWMGSKIDVDRQVVASFGQSYDLKVKKDFPSLENYDTLSLVRLYDTPKSGDMIAHANELGFNGVVLELVTSINTTPSDAIQVNADIIGNFVLASVRANEVLAK